MTCTGRARPPELARLLPTEIHGWKSEGPDGVYDSETLYEYINGGAEVYRSFNVRTVLARRYVKDGAAEIVADVYDMGSSEDAFGAYHHDVHEGPDAGIGQNSESMEGYLSFWKGQYFVCIITLDETAESKRAMLDLGKAIAERIADEGAEPNLLRFLPEKARLAHHVHYFHNHLCLSAHYFLAEDNLLHLDLDTEGVIARYKPETVSTAEEVGSYVLVLIRHMSADKAQRAYASFMKGYLPDADADGMARTENSKWAGAHLKRNFIIGVFDAPSKGTIQSVMGEVKRRLPG